MIWSVQRSEITTLQTVEHESNMSKYVFTTATSHDSGLYDRLWIIHCEWRRGRVHQYVVVRKQSYQCLHLNTIRPAAAHFTCHFSWLLITSDLSLGHDLNNITILDNSLGHLLPMKSDKLICLAAAVNWFNSMSQCVTSLFQWRIKSSDWSPHTAQTIVRSVCIMLMYV